MVGQLDFAARAARGAETAAQTADRTTGSQARALCQAAASLVATGQFDRAEHAVRQITGGPMLRASALAALAAALASAGQLQRARGIAINAEAALVASRET